MTWWILSCNTTTICITRKQLTCNVGIYYYVLCCTWSNAKKVFTLHKNRMLSFTYIMVLCISVVIEKWGLEDSVEVENVTTSKNEKKYAIAGPVFALLYTSLKNKGCLDPRRHCYYNSEYYDSNRPRLLICFWLLVLFYYIFYRFSIFLFYYIHLTSKLEINLSFK